MFRILALAAALSGCATGPSGWMQVQHREMMITCKSMCNGKVSSYEPFSGECKCRGKR